MNLTPEQIAYMNQQVPGFSSMTPAQQQQQIERVKAQAGQTPQAPSISDQAQGMLPVVGTQAGLNAVMGGGSGYAASGTLSAGGAVPAAGSTGTATAGTGVLGGLGATAGLAGAAYAGYQNFESMGGLDAIQGKGNKQSNVDAVMNSSVITAPINAGVKAILGKSIGEKLSSGKSKDQKGRDAYRAVLKEGGVYDNDYNLTLSDGSKVNLGLDGKTTNYNVDFNQEGIGDIVALANPFAYLVAGGDPKRASDLAGELTNAIKGSKDPKAEMEAIFNKAGLYKQDALSRIDQLSVDDQTKTIFKNTVQGLNISDSPEGTNNTGGATPNGGGGFRVVINAGRPAPQPKVDKLAGVKSMLFNQFAQTKQPIQYPTQNPNYQVQDSTPGFMKLAGMI